MTASAAASTSNDLATVATVHQFQAAALAFGSSDSSGFGVQQQPPWRPASNGGNIAGPSTNLNATVDAPGDYQLLVCR
jgi:hypothetical protein